MINVKTNGKNRDSKKESKNSTRISTSQLKEMVKKVVRNHLQEASAAQKRQMVLDRFKTEANLSTYEVLEDVLEFLDDKAWQEVLRGIKEKYGYRF